ncbi:MAG: hypothetical protein NVS3B7_07930 [Candidatus Elarobacter sp.]
MPQTLDADALLALANGFAAIATSVRSTLDNDAIALSPGQSAALSSKLTSLDTMAVNLSTEAAKIAFDDTAGAAAQIAAATSAACDEAAAMARNARKITGVVNVIAAVVAFGGAFGSGNPAKVLAEGANLIAAAQASKDGTVPDQA